MWYGDVMVSITWLIREASWTTLNLPKLIPQSA